MSTRYYRYTIINPMPQSNCYRCILSTDQIDQETQEMNQILISEWNHIVVHDEKLHIMFIKILYTLL